MRVIALDLGLNMGYCIGSSSSLMVEESGLHSVGKLVRKLQTKTAHDIIVDFLHQKFIENPFEYLIYEKLSFSTNTYATQAHGFYSMAVKTFCKNNGIKIFDCSPQNAKKALTGYGNADKMAMVAYAEKLVKHKVDDDNIADAIGVYKYFIDTGVSKLTLGVK